MPLASLPPILRRDPSAVLTRADLADAIDEALRPAAPHTEDRTPMPVVPVPSKAAVCKHCGEPIVRIEDGNPYAGCWEHDVAHMFLCQKPPYEPAEPLTLAAPTPPAAPDAPRVARAWKWKPSPEMWVQLDDGKFWYCNRRGEWSESRGDDTKSHLAEELTGPALADAAAKFYAWRNHDDRVDYHGCACLVNRCLRLAGYTFHQSGI